MTTPELPGAGSQQPPPLQPQQPPLEQPGYAVPTQTLPAQPAKAKKRLNVVGLIALIAAALGFIFACIPGALIVGWILLPIAFVLALVSLFLKDRAQWMGITALIVSIVGTIVGISVFFAVVATSFDNALSSGTTVVDSAEGQSSPTSTSTEDAVRVESLPFNASGLLGGTAQPTFPDGEPGKVSVVQVGPLAKDRGTLIFAFRNNTSDGISHVDWTATARSGGSIVATGSSQGTTPSQVQPGEVGLAYIYFDNSAAVPADAEYEFTASTSPIGTSFYNTAPFKVTEANLVGESIVGAATNQTGAEATGPYSVSIYCFDGDNLLSQSGTYAEQRDAIADGGTVTFSENLYGDACPTFAVGVGGYFS